MVLRLKYSFYTRVFFLPFIETLLKEHPGMAAGMQN
jgi:hypothetical protein